MKFTQNVKRGIAMLLTLAMLVSSGNFGMIFNAFAVSEDHSDHLHATLGQVLIDNLDSLNAQQKYLLKNGYLVADEQYHYAPPAEAADLVVVDSEGKTITAKPYTDSEGNLWVPTQFTLTGDAEAVLEEGALIADGEVYTGSYTATERNFSVHITYSFDLNLTAEEKAAIEAMINAGVALNEDLDVLKYLDDVSVLDGIDETTKNKILDLVGGVDPNAELVLKAMVMELDRLGEQSAVTMIASLAKDGIYLPLLEKDGEGNLSANEQGVFVNLGESTSDAYLSAMSLKQQQDAQDALNLVKLLDDYLELSDLALLAIHADKLETALKGNYAELGAVSAGLKEVQPVINKYLTDTVPGIYATVFTTVNDALASFGDILDEYGISKTVNTSEDFYKLVSDLKDIYADGLAQVNEKIDGTDYDRNPGTVGDAGIHTAADIASLKQSLERDYASNVSEINRLLREYGYTGEVTDSASLQGPIDWANGEYNKGISELNEKLIENGYDDEPVTDAMSLFLPRRWLQNQRTNGINTANQLLTDNGYTGNKVTNDPASMDAPIAWLDAQYADAINQINEKLSVLKDYEVEYTEVASSADIDPLISVLEDLRAELLAQADAAAKEAIKNISSSLSGNIQSSITSEADVDELIKDLKPLATMGIQAAQQALELAQQLKEALEMIAQAKELLPEVKSKLEMAEEAKPKLEEGKELLAMVEEALVMLEEANDKLQQFEQAMDMIPEVKGKMELAEFAVDALGMAGQLNEALVQLEEAETLLKQFDEGVAQLEEQADNLKLLIIVMDGFTSVVKPVVDAFENDSFNTPKLLKSGLSAQIYASIEQTIADATAYTGEIPEKLHVAEATVKVNVAKFDINVKYQASIVDPTKTDSLETIQLPVYEDTIALPGGATGAEIKAAVAASGLLDSALAQWGIDASKFDVQLPDLADDFLLNGDMEYTVVITPKTYILTLDFGNAGDVLDVPYGYRYTAPVHSNADMEYIYTVVTAETAELEQGNVLTVTEDTLVTRGEGKKAERMDLLDLAAKTVETNTDIKNILTSSALKLSHSFSVRVPGKEQVSVAYDAGKQATVITAPNYSSRLGDLVWVATSVTVDGVTYPMTNGVYETENAFKAADVHYALAMNPEALGFTTVELLDALNTPYKLVADYNAQKATLDDLAELMPLLKRLNDEEDIISDPTPMTLREALGMIEHLQATYNISDETVTAGKALYKMIPVNGHIALYDTMELYSHGGMYHYYRNEEAYKTQICLLDDLLRVLVNDASFMELVKDAAHGLFEEIKETLDAAADVMENVAIDHDKIDVTDANLRTLLNLMDAAQPTLYSRVPATFNWQENIHVTGLAYTNVEINVTYGGVTYTEDFVEATGTTLTQAQLLAWAEEIKAAHNVGPQYEEFFTVRNDFADTALTGVDLTFNYTWDLNEYEIKAAGTDVVIGVINYNYMHLDLPAHTEEGMRYDYMIGDLVVSAGAYELGIEQFKGLVNGTIQLTRIEIDEEQELLQQQEDMLVDFVNHMEGAGVVTKDENGKYAVIFRMDYANLMDSFTKIGAGMFLGGYDQIGFDNHVFYGEGHYYVQAFIDALLNSGAGTHTILEEINEDGTLKHVKLENATVLTNISYDNLGAEIMHSTAYFEKDGETLEADFYLTMDGTQADMQTLRSRIALVDQYLELTFEDNQAIAHLTMPEPVYAAYVAALVAAGKIDLRHVNELDTQVALAFLVELFNPMLDKDTAEWDAIMNTADMLVSGVGVDKIESAYEKILNRIDTDKAQVIYEMITSSYDSEKVVYDGKSVYIPLENIQVKELLDLVQAALNDYVDNKGAAGDINLSKIVAEYNTGVDINLTGHIENMDTDYAALFVSVTADGITNKAGLTTAAELPAIAESANLIILLDDITADLNLNGNTISIKGKTLNMPVLVDLNGKTVNGNITGTDRVIIIDSAYQSTTAPMGTVTGTVTGATIISGKYDTDVSGLLPDGYIQEANGIVHNKLYTIGTDGANNLTLTLNADYDDLLSMIDAKGIMGVALDAAMELALNNYIYSSLYLDGKQVFDIQVDDIVGMVGNDGKKQAIIDTLKSWVSKEDLKDIAQKIVDALTDYDALYEAFEDGGDGIIYQADTLVTPYDITTEKIDNDGKPYYTVNIGADTANAKTGSLTVVVIGDMRLELLKLAKALKDIVQNNVTVDISIDVFAGLENKTLFITGDFAGEVVVDLRKNPEYVLMTSVILAYGNPEIRDAMVGALNTYYAENSMEELEEVYNSLSAAQIIAAWSKVVRYEDFFTDMVDALALSDEAKAEILASVDDDMLGFKIAVELGAAMLRKLGVDGTSHTLGSFLKVDGDGCNYYGVAKSKDFLGEKNPLQDYNDILTEKNPFKDYNEYLGEKNPLWDYSVNYDISIENIGAKLYLFHTHKWDDGVEVSAPDCENEGEILYTCTDCGHTKTEKIPAVGHTYGDWITTKPATCTETGLWAHYHCSVCDKYFDSSKVEVAYDDLIIPVKEHSYGDLIPEDPASCTETGLKAHYQCSECGKYFDENKNEVAYEDLIIPYGHTYGELIPEKPATCTETGLKAHYQCSECGKYFDKNKNEVAYDDLIIPVKEHNYGTLVPEKPASCTETGLKAHYYDADCGKYFDENKNEVAYSDLVIPMKEHNYGTLVPEKPASCTETGLKAHYYDAECDKYFDENKNEVAYSDLVIPMKEHNYGNLIPEDPASCTETGLKAHYYDAECGKYFDENKNEVAYADLIIPMKEHNYGNLIPEEPASCTETGLKAHYYDAECGKYFDENKNEVAYNDLIIPMKEHNYGDWIITKPATCTEPGLKAHYYDPDCGKYFNSSKVEVSYDSLIIPPKNHDYQWNDEVPAEVGKDGMKAHYYCAECDKYFDANKNEVSRESLIIPALPGVDAPELDDVVVTPGDGIYGGAVRTEDGVKYLIVDVHARYGLTIAQLKAMFPAVINGVSITETTSVTDINGQAVTAGDDSLVATGYTVTFTATGDSGSATATYILVLLGDINCDGKTTSSDAVMNKRHVMNKSAYATRAQALAADVNCDSIFTSSDSVAIKRKVLNGANAESPYISKIPTLAN